MRTFLFHTPYAGPRGPKTPLLLLVVHVLSITLIFSTVYFFRILLRIYNYEYIDTYNFAPLRARRRASAIHDCAPRTHLSHTIGTACSRAVRGVHHERHTGANSLCSLSRSTTSTSTATYDNGQDRNTYHDDDRVRSSPKKRAPQGHKKTADTCNRSLSLHYQKSPTLIIRNTPAACKKRKHPKSHGLVSNGRGWPSSDARVGRHPPAAPAAARRLPALTPIAASCARRRLAPVGR